VQSVNNLATHDQKTCFSNQGQSRLIKVNQGIFLNRHAHHSLVTPQPRDGGITPPLRPAAPSLESAKSAVQFLRLRLAALNSFAVASGFADPASPIPIKVD
jgi:hypothetical protein